jgi:2,3-dihydroxybenzoate-AMP ligase
MPPLTQSERGVPSLHPLLPHELQAEYRRLGYWEGVTLAEVVEDWATREPERPAVVGPESFGYGELWRRARRLAGFLVDGGVQPGEFVLAVQ